MDEAAFKDAVEVARGIIDERLETNGETAAEWLGRLYELRPAELRGALLNDLMYCSTKIAAAWDGLELIAGKLRREGQPFPPDLARWLQDRPRRPTKRGPDPDGDLPRKLAVAVAIRYLARCGWKPVTRKVPRNNKKLTLCCVEGGSACDVVGVAAGIGGYKNVERIWTESASPESAIYRNSPPPVLVLIVFCPSSQRRRFVPPLGNHGFSEVEMNQQERLLRRPEVEKRTGIPTSSLYRLMRAGQFPTPIKIGTRAVAWSEAEIAEWLADRPRATGQAPA